MTDPQVYGKSWVLTLAVAALLLQGCASYTSERQLQTLIDRLAAVEQTANELSRDVEAIDVKLEKAREAATLLEKTVAEAPDKAAEEAVADVKKRSEKIAAEATGELEQQAATFRADAQSTLETSLKTMETRAAELTERLESNLARLSVASAKADRLIADIGAIAGVDQAAESVNTLLEKAEEFESAYQEVIAQREALTGNVLSANELQIVDRNNNVRALLSANSLYFKNEDGDRVIQIETNEATRSDPSIVIQQADVSGRHDKRSIMLRPTRIWLWASTASPTTTHSSIDLSVDPEKDDVTIQAWGPQVKGNSFQVPPLSFQATENGCSLAVADPKGTGGAQIVHTKRRVTGPGEVKVETDTELVLTGKSGRRLFWKAPP